MIAEKLHDAAAYGEQAASSVSEYLHRGSDQVTHMVEERPGTSVVMACLVGFGVGLLLSQLLVGEDRPYSNSFDRTTAERLGRNLLDRIEHAMPTMLREKLMK